MLSLASNAPPNIPDTIAEKSTSAVQYTLAGMFRSGIKQDATLFQTLQDEKINDGWHFYFPNQVRAQDLRMLYPIYAPTTANEQEHFTATSSGNSKITPGDICGVILKASKRVVKKRECLVSEYDHKSNMLLDDHGANGGVDENDVHTLFKKIHTVDIKSINNHHVINVPIGTDGGVVSK
jgi:hypothetical protein